MSHFTTTHSARRTARALMVLAPVLATVCAGIANAAPSISRTSGSTNGGSTITITGSGFGSTGPNIVMFDDFERGSNNAAISFVAPVGRWDKANNTPVYTSTARTGRLGFLVYDAELLAHRQLQLDLGGNHTEVFMSYWVRVPDSRFPGTNVPGLGQFSNDSSWKLTWLLDGSDAYNDPAKFDMCIPTHTGKGVMQIAGNDFNYNYVGNEWWSWNSWMRISVWYRQSASNSGFFQVVSSEKGYSSQEFGSNAIFQGTTSKSFNRLNMPGWIRTGSNTRPVYDDIYVAAGRGAVARVEVADAGTYTASRNITILPVTQWADGSIRATIPAAGTGIAGTKYLYVTDANGVTNLTGFPLTSSPDEEPAGLPPKAPAPFAVR